jgi:hypothetical protein
MRSAVDACSRARRVLAERSGVEPQSFTQTGFTLAVLEPGKPSGDVPRPDLPWS